MRLGVSPKNRNWYFVADTIAEKEARLDRGEGWKGLKTPGAPQISAQIAHHCRGYPYASNSLPQYAAGCETVTTPGRHYGKSIIKDHQHERDICARHGYTKDYSDSDYK